jgi:hypothetical protein
VDPPQHRTNDGPTGPPRRLRVLGTAGRADWSSLLYKVVAVCPGCHRQEAPQCPVVRPGGPVRACLLPARDAALPRDEARMARMKKSSMDASIPQFASIPRFRARAKRGGCGLDRLWHEAWSRRRNPPVARRGGGAPWQLGKGWFRGPYRRAWHCSSPLPAPPEARHRPSCVHVCSPDEGPNTCARPQSSAGQYRD